EPARINSLCLIPICAGDQQQALAIREIQTIDLGRPGAADVFYAIDVTVSGELINDLGVFLDLLEIRKRAVLFGGNSDVPDEDHRPRVAGPRAGCRQPADLRP